MTKNKTNPNYEEREDGFWKKDRSAVRGQSPFGKPIPPVRDSANRPLKNGGIDWDAWAKEIEDGKWRPRADALHAPHVGRRPQ